jgi:hypothetical protein
MYRKRYDTEGIGWPLTIRLVEGTMKVTIIVTTGVRPYRMTDHTGEQMARTNGK